MRRVGKSPPLAKRARCYGLHEPRLDDAILLAPIPAPRGDAAWCWLEGYGLFLAGGSTPALCGDAYRYDLEADRWHTLAPLPVARFGATAIAMEDGNTVVLVGGGGGRDEPQSKPLLYGTADDAWRIGDASLTPKYSAGRCRWGDEVLVCGGQEGRRATTFFRPDTGERRRGPSLNEARFAHSLVALGAKAAAIGGIRYGAHGLEHVESAELLDEGASRWRVVEGLLGRSGLLCCALDERRVLITGGTDAKGRPSAESQILDLEREAFLGAAPMTEPRDLATLLRWSDGSVLAIGGRTRRYQTSRTIERYDPQADQWLVVGELASARMEAVAAEPRPGHLLVAAGVHQNEGPVAETELLKL